MNNPNPIRDYPERQRFVANERFHGPARHVRIGGFIADLIDSFEPRHTLAIGIIIGALGTVASAAVWAMFL